MSVRGSFEYWLRKYLPLAVILVSTLTALETFRQYSSLRILRPTTTHELPETSQLTKRLDRLESEVQSLLKPPVLDNNADSRRLSSIAAEVTDLKKSVDNLNAAILADPAKALAVPMLRRDLDSVTQRNKDDLQAVRDEVARVYDLTKWFIGLMLTMALGLVGLAVTSFLQSKKS